MRSCIYEGIVHHRRHHPSRNEFGFRTFFFYLDLDELDTVFANSRLASVHKWAPARFCLSDHMGHKTLTSTAAIRESVIEVLRANGVLREIGPIGLLTQLRYLGFVMNPVSFYYCYAKDGRALEAVIAEVNNTPWGEQHLYVLDGRDGKIDS